MKTVTLNSLLNKQYKQYWLASRILSHVRGPIITLMKAMDEAKVQDPYMRIHGASALNVWGRDISKRYWVMAGSPTAYDNIRITLDLQEVNCAKYGRHLRYRERPQSALVHVMYPEPYVMAAMDIHIVQDEERGCDVQVASPIELHAYYAMHADTQKSLYKLSRLKR